MNDRIKRKLIELLFRCHMPQPLSHSKYDEICDADSYNKY